MFELNNFTSSILIISLLCSTVDSFFCSTSHLTPLTQVITHKWTLLVWYINYSTDYFLIHNSSARTFFLAIRMFTNVYNKMIIILLLNQSYFLILQFFHKFENTYFVQTIISGTTDMLLVDKPLIFCAIHFLIVTL